MSVAGDLLASEALGAPTIYLSAYATATIGHADQQPRRFTVEEYLALEARSEVRHEFFEGKVFATSGASIRHNPLVGNCFVALRTGLCGKSCRVLTERVQLAVEAGRYYNYPALAVTCNPSDLLAERTIEAPILLIEVLSKLTETRDRSWKFNQYKQRPSLRHYLLVSQATCLVEWCRREESGVWSFTPLALFTDAVFIPELELILTLQGVYEETGVTEMSIHPDAEEA